MSLQTLKKYKFRLLLLSGLAYFAINAIVIVRFSKEYYETPSDVGIILGAGTHEGKLSPIFKERVNHGIYLYQEGVIQYIIVTGGYGKGESISDSEAAKQYLIANGIPEKSILKEEVSRYTIQNLEEAQNIMDSLKLNSALLISDPFHMKRAMTIADWMKINALPSPTQTSKYQSLGSKSKQLLYETIFFSLRLPICIFTEP